MSAIEIKGSDGLGGMCADIREDMFGQPAIQLAAGNMPCIFLLNLAPAAARELAATLATMADELDQRASVNYRAISAMCCYGGSFERPLGVAWAMADAGNSARLASAFPELLAKFGEVADAQDKAAAAAQQVAA